VKIPFIDYKEKEQSMSRLQCLEDLHVDSNMQGNNSNIYT